MIRTASNAYFPQKLSVISLPDLGQGVFAAVAKFWDNLENVEEPAELRFAKKNKLVAAALAEYSDDQVMQAIEARRSGQDGPPQRKIKSAGFELLASGQPVMGKNEHDSVFFAEEVNPPTAGTPWHPSLQRVVVVYRLREVTVLVGYTRFDYPTTDINGEIDQDNLQTSRLGLNLDWLPASENKGQGIFLQFRKEQVDAWKQKTAVKAVVARLERGCVSWGNERGVPPRQFFGAAHVMLHSLSHLLINASSLECGYPASSIKERIYANPNEGYGILLYTAGPESYGTLGGLASTAKSLDHYLKVAIETGRLCSNDPVCEQHHADNAHERRHLHGAACHGCLLISETSCESLNDFLDQSLVVATVDCLGAEFFDDTTLSQGD